MSTIIKKCGQKVKKILIEFGQNDNPLNTRDEPPKAALGEYLTQRGAMALAKRLETYWHQKGYHAARFWAEPIGERFEKVGTYEIYRVTSNLVNGMPPRYALGYALNAITTIPELQPAY
jgi:hypothetical protein